MKAVGYYRSGLSLDDENALLDLDIPAPGLPSGRDLLVRVRALAVNPRDNKTRKAVAGTTDQPVIPGYDASGDVVATGPDAKLFRAGDAVFYAGVLGRPGSAAEFQLVDEQIVGHKPRSLNHTAAASLPLTALTAYEMLFDRLSVSREARDFAVLVVGGAGGVGSAAIQLLRQLTSAVVIATASRPQSVAWVRGLGAHHVIDHKHDLAESVAALKIDTPVRHIFSTHTGPDSWEAIARIIAPQGSIGLIDDPEPLDLRLLKIKSASVHWEMVFTRAMFATEDMIRQHWLLCDVADMVDQGKLRATLTENYGNLSASNFRKALKAVEAGNVIGKIVLEGYS